MLPTANPDVLFRAMADGAVLFSSNDEVYFGLNAVGARVWELLAPAGSIDDLCDALHRDYPDADRATIRADVEELLGQFVANGLAQPAPAAA